MADRHQRMAGAVIALLGIISVINGMFLPVFALQQDEEYPLEIRGDEQPYLYGSRYQCQLLYCGSEASTEYTTVCWNAPEILHLNYLGETEIGAYCIDPGSSSVSGNAAYRRINLEDAGCFDAGTAARIRSIVFGSFPYLSVEAVAEKVNERFREGSVRNLTQGELLSATQQAIWSVVNGGDYRIDRHYISIRGMDQYDTTDFVYPESLESCREGKYTQSNIETLYRYFLGMEGMETTEEVVTEHSFRDISYEAQRGTDGTYTVKVSFYLHEAVQVDGLSLTAFCGDRVCSQRLAQGVGQVVFYKMDEPAPIKLRVTGYQSGGNVYFFERKGDASGLSGLVGYDDTTLPVHIEIEAFPADEMSRGTGKETDLPNENRRDDDLTADQGADSKDQYVMVYDGNEMAGKLFKLVGLAFISCAMVMIFVSIRRKEMP